MGTGDSESGDSTGRSSDHGAAWSWASGGAAEVRTLVTGLRGAGEPDVADLTKKKS